MNQSKVKKFFTQVTSKSNKCDLCFKLVQGSNTTNMKVHLQKWHKQAYQSLETKSTPQVVRSPHCDVSVDDDLDVTTSMDVDSSMVSRSTNQKTIISSFSAISGFKEGGQNHTTVTSSLVYMIVKDNMPLNTVEKKGFQNFIKKTLPLYKCPSRRSITRMIDTKYDVAKSVFLNQLLQTEYVCLTCDIWTESHTTMSYLGVTVHYLDEVTLMSATLNMRSLQEGHTAAYLSSVLLEICDEWQIPLTKITAVVTDHAANIIKAVKDTFGEKKSIGCFAHQLNLVVQSAFDEAVGFKTIMAKVKQIVTYIKSSVKAYDLLRKFQLESGSSEDQILKMKQECPTRWNSAFYMLERFILLSKIIARVLFQLDTAPQNLSSLEIKVIKESIILLQPFEEITKEIAGEKFMTASKIIPIRTLLKKNLESHIISVTNEGKMLQQRLKIEFYQRFHNVEKETLLAICTILDPRFKRVHFQSPLSAANAIDLIDAEIRKATRTYRPENTSVGEVSIEKNKISLWGEHDTMVNTENIQYNDDEVNCEKRLYLQQPIIDRKQSPIEFWLKSPFPILTKIALKYLTVVATSVPSERLFSKAGNIITDNRSRLNHRRLEKLVFLSSLECKFWDI